MNLRFKFASGDGVVHAGDDIDLVLCQPNLAGYPIYSTDDPVTCQECSAIQDGVRTVTEEATHAVRSHPLRGRAGRTRCGRAFEWTLRQDGDEANQMSRADREVDCMACIAAEVANA